MYQCCRTWCYEIWNVPVSTKGPWARKVTSFCEQDKLCGWPSDLKFCMCSYGSFRAGPCLSVILANHTRPSPSWWQWRSQEPPFNASLSWPGLNNGFIELSQQSQQICYILLISACVFNVQVQEHCWCITIQYVSCSHIFNEINLCAFQRYPKSQVPSTRHNLGSGWLAESRIRWALDLSLEQVATGCGCTGYMFKRYAPNGFFGSVVVRKCCALVTRFCAEYRARNCFLVEKNALLSCKAAKPLQPRKSGLVECEVRSMGFGMFFGTFFHSCETTVASSIGY